MECSDECSTGVKVKTKTKHGSMHIGYNTRYQKNGKPKLTRNTIDYCVMDWIHKIPFLFTKIDGVLKTRFPNFAKVLEHIQIPERNLGLYPAGFINLNYAVAPHIDEGDYEYGVGCVVTFGDYAKGGELVLHNWRVAIKMMPGDAAFIPAHKVVHSVAPYSGGQRNSLVLYAHQVFVGQK